jgi:hypothetical protein
MSRTFLTAACLTVGLGLVTSPDVHGQTSYPMIGDAFPVAIQRGKSTEVTVEGQMNFAGVYEVLIEGTGVRAEVVGPDKAEPVPRRRTPRGAVKLRWTVTPGAALGIREFRLASSLGISSIGQIVVVDDPVVIEKGDNNTPDRANPITVPSVVCGRIERVEDVDCFKFHALAGQTISCEVLCARLEDKIHDLQNHADPLLTLLDSEGREVAANDDFYFADSLLTCRIKKTGDHILQIRDSKYGGDVRWVYAILVTDRPYVTQVYPMAGNPGRKIRVHLAGPAGTNRGEVDLQVPAEAGIERIQLDLDGKKTNPFTFISSPLPQVMEEEPNDTPDQANRISIPCGINGRIAAPRDLDHFRFSAHKGKPIRFEIKARRFGTQLQSSLDSVLDVLSAKGAVLASNDDAYGKDAALVFNPPADGEYMLRVRDLNGKGNENAVYYLEADWARPDFTLRCDPDKAMIGPGSSAAWYVQVARSNGFAGPVEVHLEGLPAGVTASPLTIPAGMTQGLLVLTAAAGAPRGAANVQLIGTAAGITPLRHVATPIEEIYMPGGGRGRFDVNLQTVAVTDPSDILRVDVTPPAVTLRPGQEARLDVTIQRRPDHDKGVSLDVLLQHLGGVYGNPLPPGVTVVEAKSKTLLGKGSLGHIVLRAAPNAAPIEHVPISVLANVSINFVVKISYSSPPVWLSVRK